MAFPKKASAEETILPARQVVLVLITYYIVMKRHIQTHLLYIFLYFSICFHYDGMLIGCSLLSIRSITKHTALLRVTEDSQ